jgi:hypothetical protein
MLFYAKMNINFSHIMTKDLIKFITGPENGLSPLIFGAVGGACVLFVITVAICIAMKYKSNNDR